MRRLEGVCPLGGDASTQTLPALSAEEDVSTLPICSFENILYFLKKN